MNQVIRVVHLIDTLDPGGAERVAVNIVNSLPPSRFGPHLVTSRHDGALARFVAPYVERLSLHRAHRFDLSAIQRLHQYIVANQIDIVHAHGPSIFLAQASRCFRARPLLIWHAHFGRRALEDQLALHYLFALRNVDAVVAVSQDLAEWTSRRLRVPDQRVFCLANPVSLHVGSDTPEHLPGTPGYRIVCVANLRPEKDHPTLLEGFLRVISLYPAAHLILVGAPTDRGVERRVFECIREHGLSGNVTCLGSRDDIQSILSACDIGVLSSRSEGSPMALVEYGLAGLPVVATNVGNCPEIVDHGRAGLLVEPGDSLALADALIALLANRARRHDLANCFRQRAEELYRDGPIRQFHRLYHSLCAEPTLCAAV